MRTPRLAGLGLATIAAAAFAVSGCSNDRAPDAGSSTGPVTGASSASAADPAAVQALAAATATLGNTSYRVTATSGSGFKMTGGIDPAKGVGVADLAATGQNAALNVKTLLIEQDLYVQIPGLTKSGTWTHLDGSRLPASAQIGLRPGQIDPVNTAQLLASSTDVHTTGGNSYAGTLDLTKAAGLANLGQVTAGASAAPVQAVPFTAGIDAQGRLAQLTVEIPAVSGQPAAPLDVLYTNYGEPVDATRPAASEVTEAPDSIYQSLGG